jgi:sec-independent protein translocase protein TatA
MSCPEASVDQQVGKTVHSPQQPYGRKDHMFGIGMPEMIVILIVALVFFGPGKLPDLGNSIGKAIRGFKKAMEEPDTKPDPNQDKQG